MCLKIGFSEFSKSVRSKGLFRGCKSPGEGEDVGGCYNGLGVEVGVEAGVVVSIHDLVENEGSIVYPPPPLPRT